MAYTNKDIITVALRIFSFPEYAIFWKFCFVRVEKCTSFWLKLVKNVTFLDESSEKKKEKRKKHKEYTEADLLFKDAKKKLRGKIEGAQLEELFPDYRKTSSLKFLKLFEHAPNNIYPNPYRFLNNKKSVQETDPLADSQKDKQPKKGEIDPLRTAKARVT